jgi:23S rRNA (uracil1939-C5)-methyltransferase
MMRLTIEKLIYGGDGLARLPADERGAGKAAFIPFVLAGECVEAEVVEQKPGFARARALEIRERSAQRITPGCPYFQACGGCHYQQAAYPHQLEIKAAIVRETMRRVAKTELPAELRVHASPPWEYRNRTRMRVRTSPQFALGYYRFASHELLPVERCPISSPLLNRAIAAIWTAGRTGKVPAGLREIELFANHDDSALLIQTFGDRGASEALSGALRELLPELTAGAHLTYCTAAGSYRVSAGSFFQTNLFLSDELISVVTSGRSGALALDLYAGVGLFTVPLARSFERVIAVESAPSSSEDLRHNAPRNAKPKWATTEEALQSSYKRLDLVVVDPPRGGLEPRVTAALCKLSPARITYVSCDPATLARDTQALLAGGYRIEEAHLLDLFPQTFHIESVLSLVQ